MAPVLINPEQVNPDWELRTVWIARFHAYSLQALGLRSRWMHVGFVREPIEHYSSIDRDPARVV